MKKVLSLIFVCMLLLCLCACRNACACCKSCTCGKCDTQSTEPSTTVDLSKAQMSAALQKLNAAYKEAYALALSDDGTIAADETTTASEFTFRFGANGDTCEITAYPSDFDFTGTFANGTWTVTSN